MSIAFLNFYFEWPLPSSASGCPESPKKDPLRLWECPFTDALLTMATFGPDQGADQNLPKIAGLRKKKLGRTGAHFWTSGSKLHKTVPAIIAQFGHEFRIFQSCRFLLKRFDPRIWGSAILEFDWNIFKCFLVIQTNRKVLRHFKRLRVL